jgi:inosine-uridine nucleoside N-ribohydrolase
LGSVEVETSSLLTNGVTIFTPADRLPKAEFASTQVARQVDVRRFIDMFLDRLSAAPRGK